MPNERVLVVDDELSMREFLSILLKRDEYEVDTASSGEEALEKAKKDWPDLVLSDLNMPGMTGIDLLRALKNEGSKRRTDVSVVLVTAFGTTESAVEAMHLGAADYVTKPFNNDELRLVVRRVLGRRRLEEENLRLRVALKERYHFGNLVGSSQAMVVVYDLIGRVKDSRINCLITGESGSGKEMVARAIHYSGSRSQYPFTAINCGAIPEELVESELFGHHKGAFTGAVKDKMGLIQSAHKGTLFLDEVASLPLGTQVKLLRVLQERRLTPVGSVKEIEVDIRLLAASNLPLEDLVAAGQFREDLFYRLNVVEIHVPPLRERTEDIALLAQHFLGIFTQEYDRNIRGLEPDAMKTLKRWNYPGNVRELQNVLERAVALCSGSVLRVDDLPARMRGGVDEPEPSNGEITVSEDGVNLDALLSGLEKEWLLRALDTTKGNKTAAARLLHLSFRSFRYRLAKFGLDSD